MNRVLKTFAMKKIIFIPVLLLFISAVKQQTAPDLSKKEDLMALGIGKIFEKDNSIIKNITLNEVKEYWITYIKDKSLHDLAMEKISRIEFLQSKWGEVKMEFPDNKPKVTGIAY